MNSAVAEIRPGGDLPVVPRHVAIIMDGNGRWAQRRGLPRLAGHNAGTENVRRIIRVCPDLHIRILTLYAFSTENWSRPRDEVDGLMALLSQSIDRELGNLHKHGVQIRHLGALDGLPASLQTKIRSATEMTAGNDRLILNIALNYGGRQEIVEAVRRMMRERLTPEQVTEEELSRHLYSGDLPDPDLIIRTAGEMRLSNFLIWQAAYAEYYSSAVLWPDFAPDELQKALAAFAQRTRKFGRLLDAETTT
jgi:undecaprenyl diphosphate synthase